ncbi:MAG: DNA polymerase I, partial [Candidatus Vecturithrix sp.]|nr:DNA polymerase I [Candidatus Vecturithrix sp.]
VYKAFYAIQSLSTSKGFPTNAIFGFIRMLIKLIQDESPQYLGVSFDLAAPTFRHELFEAYKAHRPDTPDELIQQVPKIKAFLKAMNIPIYEMEGYEADDVLATLAKKAEQQGMKTVIVSSDKDLLQLVSENIVTLSERMGHKVVYTPEKVKEKYGITPAQMQDFLGLVGDSSDNIPGIQGIGPKTASKLLEEFGSVENVLEHLDAVKSPKLQESLKQGKETALQSKFLATVKTDVPIELNLEELRYVTPNYQELKAYFHDLEFYSFIRELIPAEEFGYPPLATDEEQPRAIPKQYQTVLTEEQLAQVIEELQQSGGFAVDTETTSEQPMKAELVGVSVATIPHQGYYIPVGHRYIGAPQQLPLDLVIQRLKPLLEDATLPKYGQNIKYDIIVLAHYGIHLQGAAFDSMLASYVLDPSKRSHGMDYLAQEYLQYQTITYHDVVGKGVKQTTIDMIPVERVTEYAAEDADITLQLTNVLKPKIQEQQLEQLYQEVELPLIDVLAAMERHGVKVDIALLERISRELSEKMRGIEQRIYQIAGVEFNINSPKQLGPILFEKLQMPHGKKTKTGYSTDVDVLTDLARAGYELPEKILEYRQLSKLKSTYSDALPKQIDPKTGRIHTSYNQTVTATGRLSSSDPNLQNIPIRTEEGRRIRQAFIPEHGCVLLSADYSQIELRILAHVTGDAELVKAYQEDQDIHTKTAMQLFDLPAAEITSNMRREAKTVNFSVIYGISAFSLAKDLNIPRHEAQRYIDEYFRLYKGVNQFINDTIEHTRQQGYVTTLLNRIRYIPEIHSKNNNVRQFGERTAVNTPIQGTAADMIKLAMIAIHERLTRDFPETKMIMQVHDELVFEVPEAQAEEVRELVVKQMEAVLDLRVPIKVDAYYGKNWDEAH